MVRAPRLSDGETEASRELLLETVPVGRGDRGSDIVRFGTGGSADEVDSLPVEPKRFRRLFWLILFSKRDIVGR